MLTGDQRRIQQSGKRDRSELNVIARCVRRCQSRSKFPSDRKLNARNEFDRAGIGALRIKNNGIPIEIEKIAGGGRTSSARTVIRSDCIQRYVNRARAFGHRNVKGVHINIVALPRNRLASSLHMNAGEGRDRPARTMIARNPLGKYQSHRAGLGGNAQLRMIEIPRSVGEVHMQLDGLSKDETVRAP